MRKFFAGAATMLALALVALTPLAAHATHCSDYSFCTEGGSATSNDGRTFTFSYHGGEGQPFGVFRVDVVSPSGRTIHLGNFRFDANGNFDITVYVPSSAGPGPYTLRAVGPSRFGGQLTVTAGITVSGPGGGGLTKTGSDVLPIGLAGIGTVLVGGTALGLSRRRKSKIPA